MKRTKIGKKTYSQTSRPENPDELQLHNLVKIRPLAVLLLFAQHKTNFGG
jgi:hypothetical protein